MNRTCIRFDSRQHIRVANMIDEHLSVDIMLNSHRAHMTVNSTEENPHSATKHSFSVDLLEFDWVRFVCDTDHLLIVVQTFQFTFEWHVVVVHVGVEHALRSVACERGRQSAPLHVPHLWLPRRSPNRPGRYRI